MALLKLLAKVKLFSESDMELAEGNVPEDRAKWKRKMIAIYADDIVRLVKYDQGRTILEDRWEIKTMVYEPFDQVFEKWEKGLLEDEIEDKDNGDDTENEEEEIPQPPTEEEKDEDD